MHVFDAPYRLSDDEAASWAGRFVETVPPRLVGGRSGPPVRVNKPDGSPLVVYVPEAMSPRVADAALPVMVEAATKARGSRNRTIAAGEWDARTGSPLQARADGTVTKTKAGDVVQSTILGYFERTPRFPYCRETAITLDTPGLFEATREIVAAADRTFLVYMPDRHASQKAHARATDPAWRLHGSSFSTVTVNRNFRTAIHQDAGDLRAGFGVMAVLERGRYNGGLLVFPQYGVGVDMRHRAVCLADVHEWHGNTAIEPVTRFYDRVSCVFYFREQIRHCLPPVAEAHRIKTRKAGDPLF